MNTRNVRRCIVAVAALIAVLFLTGAAQPAHAAQIGKFDMRGNILISDQLNNRVIEIDKNKNIVWSYGSNDPAKCNPGPGTIIAPNFVGRLNNGLTLMAGTGTAACADNRVIIVNQAGNIVWQYGQAGVAGSDANQLNVPAFALQLPNHNIMIVVFKLVVQLPKHLRPPVAQPQHHDRGSGQQPTDRGGLQHKNDRLHLWRDHRPRRTQ